MSTTAYDTACDADSPSHTLLMNEASGNVVDSVSGGIWTPTSVTYGSASWLTGENAITFNGTTSKLAAGTPFATGTTCTFEFLLFPIAGGDYGAMFTEDDVAGIYYRSGSTKKIDVFVGGTDNLSATALPESAWVVHVAIVINAGAGTFYINGIPDGTFTGFPGFTLNSIGTDPSLEAFKGRLSRLRYYPTALTAAKVLAHFAALNGPAQNTVTIPTPSPTKYYTSESIIASNGVIKYFGEASGSAMAVVVGGSYAATLGINSTPVVSITSGKIVIPYAGAIGTVATVISTTGPLWSANDVANSANGAAFAQISSGNLSAQIITDAGGSDGAVNDGASKSGMNIAMVVICTFDDAHKTARLTVNGFSFAASYTGVPKVATALELMGKYSSGALGAGTGIFHRCAIYSSPLTVAQETSLTTQFATIFGAPMTKRVSFTSHNSADSTLWAVESDDGLTFVNPRKVSFASPVGAGQNRDMSPEGYDAVNDVLYYCYTENNFAQIGTTFGRAKCKAAFVGQLMLPAASVDCLNAAPIGAATNSPWGPIPVITNGVVTGYVITESNTATRYYSPTTNWPAAPTFSSATVLTGNYGDQGTLVPPSNPGNPSASLFRNYDSGGVYQTASAVTGSYGSNVTLSGGSVGEGGFVLKLDGNFIFYNPANVGYLAWVSTDNGATFGTVQTPQGLNVATGGPIDMGQGTMFDRNTLPAAASAGGGSNVGSGFGVKFGIGTGLHVGGGISF